jgi:hypothetical protein
VLGKQVVGMDAQRVGLYNIAQAGMHRIVSSNSQVLVVQGGNHGASNSNNYGKDL